MALSMEEERILTEIASQLSEADPGLARRFSRFGRNRHRRRSRRVRLIVTISGVVTVLAAAVAVAVIIAIT
jgi:hypothetical protein